MYEKILPLKLGQYITIQKKKFNKGIYGKATNEEIKDLKQEGMETQTIPWIEDKEN